MLENMTQHDLEMFLAELAGRGYTFERPPKRQKRCFLPEGFEYKYARWPEVDKAIFEIADALTNNFNRHGKNEYRNKYVPDLMQPKYQEICYALAQAVDSVSDESMLKDNYKSEIKEGEGN